jgi:pimeloyl-ACP methyl ester carboxylesterase
MPAHQYADASADIPYSGRFPVDGYHLFLRAMGHGFPTVILDSGLGRTSDDWLRSGILDQIASFSQVCAYDRAGLGQSDPLPMPMPRTARQLAVDLATLLQAAQLPSPYILVAHSFGGLIARSFAQAHPAETAGLVLIDAMHEDDASTVLALLPSATPGELASLTDYRAAFLETVSLEPEPIDWATSTREMRDIDSVGACPVVVMTAERFELVPPDFPAALVSQLAQNHQALQQHLTSLSSNSRQLIARGCGHVVMQDHPEYIVQAVRELVEQVRAGASV